MRLALFLSFLMISLFAAGNAACADEISVRAGLHDDYSRLVFDWPSPTNYSTSRQNAGTFDITFNKNAGLNTAQIQGKKVRNIEGLEVLSESPLKVRVQLPAKSDVRDFTAGSRVIIDFYNPAGAALEAKPISIQKSAASPTKPEPKEEEEEEEAQPVEQSVGTPTAISANEPPPVEDQLTAIDANAEQPKDTAEQPIRITGSEKPNIITVSSTSTFGFASFVKDSTLWLISEGDGNLIAPQVNGPQAQYFKPILPAAAENARAFTAKLPFPAKLQAQGGNVLWRILASNDIKLDDGRAPIRRNVYADASRSGYVFWPMPSVREIVEITDPTTEETIYVALVGEDDDFVSEEHYFVDFTVLKSPAGIAIIPKNDDISVNVISGGVEISRKNGLAISEEERAAMVRRKNAAEESAIAEYAETGLQRIYNFDGWKMGGAQALAGNRTIILSRLSEMSPSERASNLLLLAKAYLANNFGTESLGLLRFVETEIPNISSTPEFLALRGAARALSGQNALAFSDLSVDGLKTFPEINVWRAYVLAGLGDWQQAASVVPPNAAEIINVYPPLIRSAMGLGLAEINLRSGKPVIADKFMSMAEKDYPHLPPHLRGSLIYLQGEKARQEGSNELTEKSWLRLARGEDDLFRVKGSLALTRFLVDQGKMPPRQAIDKLEGLRYAWRGDDLEANVNYWLGRTYFENNDYIKGLNIMRDASTYASHSGLAEKITNDMSQLYIDLFTGDKLKDVPPEDAVNLYEQFRELSPPDDRGDKIVERLAEHLANAGLVGRAGDLMKNQVDHRLKGYDAFRIATRLAALRLLDDKPDDAMDAIKKAESILGELPEEQKTDKNARMVELLKARSYSGKGNADRALELLRDMELSPDLNRLKAEIAWKASYWDDAAEALHDVILDQNLSLTRPLEDDQAALLIQRAVALNLGGDRVALANMRERYSDAMAQTEQAKIFEIITRPRQSITLADRETLLSVVSEIELFDGILQAIRAGEDADLEASTTNSVEDNVDPEQDTAAETAQ